MLEISSVQFLQTSSMKSGQRQEFSVSLNIYTFDSAVGVFMF